MNRLLSQLLRQENLISRPIHFATKLFNNFGNIVSVALIIQLPVQILAGWGGNSNGGVDTSIYGMSMQRDWLYDSSSIAIKHEGCVWSYVDDRESMGCMDDESEDGTTYWYQMANCKRAQVAYSVYATSSGTTSCSKGDFKESLMTNSGVAEFAYTMGQYSYNSPISENDVADFPICEAYGNYYLSVGCSSSGTYTIDQFTDQYCTEWSGTYDTLDNFNSAMSSLSRCYSAYSSDESSYTSLAAYLIPESGTCSAQESNYCTTSNFISRAGSSSGFQRTSSGLDISFTNKLKYGLGGAMLLGSLIMFLGILFTNRRKRRALMRRKFKNGPSSRSKSKKSSSSKARRRKKKETGSGGVFA